MALHLPLHKRILRKKYILAFITVVVCIVMLIFQRIHTGVFSNNGNIDRRLSSRSNNPNRGNSFPDVTLARIFSIDHSWTSTIAAEKVMTVLATGDFIPARSVNYQSSVRNDYYWPYRNLGSLLQSTDLAVINLESPLLHECPVSSEGMVFCGNKEHVKALRSFGVDAANLANNHSFNYGESGIEETISILNESNILPFGRKRAESIIIRKDMRIGLLGYNDIGSTPEYLGKADETKIISDIHSLKTQVDIIIVGFHWGIEYEEFPSERQTYLAHIAVDNGAHLVIGNHPHRVQPVEIYKGVPIMYAHGNTIFDQMWSEETKRGVIGKYTFFGNKVIDIQFIPTYIIDYGQAVLSNAVVNDVIIGDLKRASHTWNDRILYTD